MASLLAVDVGVRTGLACWDDMPRLRWYRSHNFGAASRLKRAIPGILDQVGDLSRLVLEGGGPLADAWAHEGERRGLQVVRTSAEEWRAIFLLPREQRTGTKAKETAGRLARVAIVWGGGPRPTSLTHDAAEAVLLGVWGVLGAGWVREVPEGLRR